MAQRRTPRTTAGPGRGARPGTGAGSRRPRSAGTTPRARAQARAKARSGAAATPPAPAASPASPDEAPAAAPRFRRTLGVTRRAVALAVVLAMLVLSYASSLRIYLTQQSDAATARAEIAATQERIDSLRDHLDRWDDPAYVQAQARARLGWVMPGETGFVVLGPDGQPVDGGTTIGSERSDGDRPDADAWWARMAGSLEAADHPAPPPKETAEVPEPGRPR